jgi:CBS-domain-containing membrane protein
MNGRTPAGPAPLDRFEGGRFESRIDRRPFGAAYTGLLCLVVLALSGAVGLLLKQPWLFPSLGPTVMLFFESPRERSARPLNTIAGHLIGLVIGYACYLAFGLNGMAPAPVGGLTPAYVAAGALSVALTTAVLTLLALPHPPAGATTLLVSLGILAKPVDLLDVAGAVVLITLAGWAVNRLLLGRRRS